MAKTNGKAEDGPTTGHNVGDVLDEIAACNEKAFSLKQQIEAAMEKHVQPLKDELTKLFRNTKADTTVPIGVLKAHFKLFEMARNAEDDEEGGGETLDGMRLAFEALQRGGQLDWLDAVSVTHSEGGAPAFVGEAAKA